MIGQRLGDYLLLARIGRGGMGAVYLAQGPGEQRVALKVLEQVGEGDGGLRRFSQELDALRRIEHPRIVRALGPLQRQGERRWFVMEYVRGRNLAQLLLEQGRLDPVPALALVGDALEGVAAAHAAGVLHRDLKSANLLVDEAGRAKVCDFGLARAVDQTRLTLSGNVLGTPAYLSPEQARGHESRVESDLYSLGVVLYEALTGSLPFQAETPLALLRQHLDEEPDPPSRRRPGLPAELDALVLRALAKQPQQRFPSAEAFREELLAVRQRLEHGSAPLDQLTTTIQRLVEAETQSLEAQAEQTLSRARGRGAAAALVLAGVAAGGLLLSGWWPGAPPAAIPAPVAGVSSQTEARPAPSATVVLHDGRRLQGQLVAIAAGTVTLRDAQGQERTLPRAEVRTISYGEER